MLLLRAEGYSYRDIAHALHVNETSVGVLLARARRAFARSTGSRRMHLDEERISAGPARELSPAEEREARQHLSGCAECRRLLAEAGAGRRGR